MANATLDDQGSRRHLLDLLEGDFRSALNRLIAPSGLRLADCPYPQPHGRQNSDAWAEYEVEEYLNAPTQASLRLPRVNEKWWIPYKNELNSRPTWDLICLLRKEQDVPGILLVEAKANVPELNPKQGMSKSTGSSESDANEKRIKRRIKETQTILNKLNRTRVSLPFDTHFQLVNRLVYSCQLASLGYNVILLYLGFLNDRHCKPILSDRHWQRIMGGYCEGVIAQSFPEIRHKFDGGGSLQMLIETLPVTRISTKKVKTKKA